jgi:hypothetical protein
MTTIESMGTNKKTARIAGLLYLIVVVTGFFSIIYVPSQITVDGDASATVSNIMASKQFFRLGIVMGLICYTAFLLLPFALYKLLGQIGKGAAVLMVAFAVVSVPISFVNLLNKLNILSLLSEANYLRAFTAEQLHAQVMLSLDAYGNGILVSEIFWGLWLLPFGYLVFKSGFLPKVLGILLMIGCLGYLINFFGEVLFPGYAETSIATFASLPSGLGEIGTCLWLLIVGIREPKSRIVSARDAA